MRKNFLQKLNKNKIYLDKTFVRFKKKIAKIESRFVFKFFSRSLKKNSQKLLKKIPQDSKLQLTCLISEIVSVLVAHVGLTSFFCRQALESHFRVIADDDGPLTQNQDGARHHQKNCRQEESEHELLIFRLQVEADDRVGGVEIRVEAGEPGASVVVGSVLGVSPEEFLALVP